MKAHFDGIPIAADWDKQYRCLLLPLGFYSVRYSRWFFVPVGFLSDGRSVPRILTFAYARYGGYNAPDAWLHDYLYVFGDVEGVTRPQADDIFDEALEATGHGSKARAVMYHGVRLGGRWSYDCSLANKAERKLDASHPFVVNAVQRFMQYHSAGATT